MLLFKLVVRAKDCRKQFFARAFFSPKEGKFMRRDVLAFGSVSLLMFLLLATTIWYMLTQVR